MKKNVQHHFPLWNCKLKQHTITKLLGWLKSKKLSTPKISKDAEQ